MRIKQFRPRWLKIRAFTITETLVAMLISGIVLLCVYEGIGTIKRYTDKLRVGMEQGNDLLNGVERLESLFARSDSVHRNGVNYVLYGAGDPVTVWRSDSLLMADHPRRLDTLFSTVLSISEKPSGPDPQKIDSLFITFGLAGRSICLGFGPAVREGSIMERIREREAYVERAIWK